MGWDGFAKTNRWITLRQVGLCIASQPVDASGEGPLALHHHPAAKQFQCLRCWSPFHLHPIAAPMAEAWVGDALLQQAVIGEQQEAFAIGIQPPCWVDLG